MQRRYSLEIRSFVEAVLAELQLTTYNSRYSLQGTGYKLQLTSYRFVDDVLSELGDRVTEAESTAALEFSDADSCLLLHEFVGSLVRTAWSMLPYDSSLITHCLLLATHYSFLIHH